MRAVLARVKAEPALVCGAAAALIALGVSFGARLSTDQVGALMAAVSAVAALVTRAQVTPLVSLPAPLAELAAVVVAPLAAVAAPLPVAVPVSAPVLPEVVDRAPVPPTP